MKYFDYGIDCFGHTITHIIILSLLLVPKLAWADNFVHLQGYWQCQEEGQQVTLEFLSRQQLLYNGQSVNYQLAPNAIHVQEENGLATYIFTMQESFLVILSPDGSVTRCQKAKKPQQTKTQPESGKSASSPTQSHSYDQAWPPPYVPPQGPIDEYNPGTQTLLYKFAGRWDNVTSNTLTNLFLKPDGTYEEAYEAGYGGVFKDQGGYQTGNWGATGAQQAQGRWKVVGGLRQGQLYLVNQHGSESVIPYQVHIKGGEVFWGEYFFNGQLYSVEYIYH